MLVKLQSLFTEAYVDMISVSNGFKSLCEKADEISKIWAMNHGRYVTTKVMEKIFSTTTRQLRHAIGNEESEDALSLKELVLAIHTVALQVCNCSITH